MHICKRDEAAWLFWDFYSFSLIHLLPSFWTSESSANLKPCVAQFPPIAWYDFHSCLSCVHFPKLIIGEPGTLIYYITLFCNSHSASYFCDLYRHLMPSTALTRHLGMLPRTWLSLYLTFIFLWLLCWLRCLPVCGFDGFRYCSSQSSFYCYSNLSICFHSSTHCTFAFLHYSYLNHDGFWLDLRIQSAFKLFLFASVILILHSSVSSVYSPSFAPRVNRVINVDKPTSIAFCFMKSLC